MVWCANITYFLTFEERLLAILEVHGPVVTAQHIGSGFESRGRPTSDQKKVGK